MNIVPLAGGTKSSSSQTDSRPVDEFLVFDPHNLQITVKNSPVDSNGRRVGLSDGSWHFLAVTWRSSDGLAEVIVDGLPRVAASNVRKGEKLLQGGCLAIGQRQVRLFYRFQFRSDETIGRVCGTVQRQRERRVRDQWTRRML